MNDFPLIPRIRADNTICPHCDLPIAESPLPPGMRPQWQVTCQIGSVEHSYLVHGECLGPTNYFRWAAIQAYQKWKQAHG